MTGAPGETAGPESRRSGADIARILRQSRTVAVVGWSENPERPSHWIADYLERAGYCVFRVNPRYAGRAEPRVYAFLRDIPEPVDVVDVFRNPAQVPPVLEEARAAGAKVFWMQPGAENPQAAAEAEAAGMTAVLGRCMYAEHRALA